jgi:hypothetical protein
LELPTEAHVFDPPGVNPAQFLHGFRPAAGSR